MQSTLMSLQLFAKPYLEMRKGNLISNERIILIKGLYKGAELILSAIHQTKYIFRF